MTQGQSLVKGDTFQKIASVGFIIGAILFGVSGLLMPHANNLTSDLQEMLKPLGEYAFLTQLSSLLMAIGFWAAMIGATGVVRSINAGGSGWARVGFNIILVGTALWTISLSLDVAIASAIAKWLAAPTDGKEAAWGAVIALNAVGQGAVPMTWTIYWLAFAFLDIGMIRSDVYPRWLGWTGLIVSIPMIVLGIIQIFTERSTSLTLVFAILMLLTALWDLVVGIWVARRAW